MIPQFPQFKQLELEDKEAIESITSSYPPYSDYNFVSIYSYNTDNSAQISLLNDNLVVKFPHYISTQAFYSFFGTNNIVETATTLLQFAKEKKDDTTLQLIPEVSILADPLLQEKFIVEEDIDNFDYVLSVQGLSHLEGKEYAVKRNFVNRFIKKYPHHVAKELDVADTDIHKEIHDLFQLWGQNGNKTEDESANELKAITRLLDAASHFQLFSLGIYVDEKLIAFSINELVQEKYAVIHFEKADISYEGVFQYMKHITAKMLGEKEYVFINYEQDLGLEGLRKAKQSYHPVSFLKKFIIKEK